MRDEVFFPGDILDQPLGSGTKHYDFETVTELLYDLEPYSSYDEQFDPIGLLSGAINGEKTIHG